MTAEDTIRFLEHEARACRERDQHEALCLLLPALLRIRGLLPMDDVEARAFACQLKQALTADLRAQAA